MNATQKRLAASTAGDMCSGWTLGRVRNTVQSSFINAAPTRQAVVRPRPRPHPIPPYQLAKRGLRRNGSQPFLRFIILQFCRYLMSSLPGDFRRSIPSDFQQLLALKLRVVGISDFTRNPMSLYLNPNRGDTWLDCRQWATHRLHGRQIPAQNEEGMS